MKFLSLCILTGTLFCLNAPAQSNTNEAFSLVSKVQFSNNKEKAIQVLPLETAGNLLLISKNEVRLWKPFEPAVLYSATHDIYANRGFLSKLIKFNSYVVINRLGTKGIIINEEKGKDNDSAAVWDLQKGEKAAVLERSKKPTRTAQFSENGKIIITTHGDLKDSEIAFWDADTYAFRSSIDVQDLAWYHLSPDGEKVFTISGKAKKWLGVIVTDFKDANGIGLWNTKTGDFEKEYNSQNINVGSQYAATPVLSKDGKLLTLETEDGVVVWNTNDNSKPLYTISSKNMEEKAKSAGVTPDGKYFLVADDGKIKFYDFAEGKFQKEFSIRKDQSFEITNDNSFAVIRSFGSASIVNLENGESFAYLPVETFETDYTQDCYSNCKYEIESLKISPNGKYILIYGDKYVRVYDVPTGKLLQAFAHPQDAKFKKNKKIEDNGLSADAGWLAENNAIYVASKDRNEYLIWKAK